MMNFACFRNLAVAVVFALCLCHSARSQELKPGEVEVVYDRFKDATTIRLKPMLLGANSEKGLELAAALGFPGKSIPSLDQLGLIGFQLISVSDRWEYADDRELIFLVDGERVPMGEMTRNAARTVNSIVFESLLVGMPYKTFMRIASGRKVEGRIGRTEFELKPEHMKAMREFAKQMQP